MEPIKISFRRGSGSWSSTWMWTPGCAGRPDPFFYVLLEILIRLPGGLLCPVCADETEGVVDVQKRGLVVHTV